MVSYMAKNKRTSLNQLIRGLGPVHVRRRRGPQTEASLASTLDDLLAAQRAHGHSLYTPWPSSIKVENRPETAARNATYPKGAAHENLQVRTKGRG